MIEKPLKIGVFLSPEDSPELGGGFSYVNQLVRAIDQYEFDEKLDFVFISYSTLSSAFKKKTYQFTANQKWSFKLISLKIAHKLFRINYITDLLSKENFEREKTFLIQSYLTQQLEEWGIDLVYYPKPVVFVKNFPFVITNWDIGHRTMYPFPEVSINGVFESREKYYQNDVSKAFLIITESNKGKQELVNLYQIPPDRIQILPMFPGSIVDMDMGQEKIKKILSQINIQTPFFFYPAQFWAHKNHYNLLKAFALIEKKYPEYKLILTGSDKGNLNYIKEVIKLYGLNDKVIYLGFVDESILYALYHTATALVMPTLLGPTNMPLLEAKALKCPVICSDLEGHREIMGNYAEYFNPTSPEDIAYKMINTIKRQQKSYGLSADNESFKPSIDVLEKIFLEIYPIRKMF